MQFLVVFACFFVFKNSTLVFGVHNAIASVEYLANCRPDQGTGLGLDGSDCSVGMMCDPYVKICVYSNSVACKGKTHPCGIGQKCVSRDGSIAGAGIAGTCAQASNTSSENNAIGDVICNAYAFATGRAGRAVIAVVVFVTGVTFYLGKVSWGTVVAILVGAGLCFGGPAIVSVLIGRGGTC